MDQSDALPDSLAGTRWVLTHLDGNAPVEGSTITLHFGTVAELGGSAGCNRYRTTYRIDDDKFRIAGGRIALTRRYCGAPAGMMEQEQRYVDALGSVTRHRITADELHLETADGRVLIYSRQGE
jgi:heat shock protein HslJ